MPSDEETDQASSTAAGTYTESLMKESAAGNEAENHVRRHAVL